MKLLFCDIRLLFFTLSLLVTPFLLAAESSPELKAELEAMKKKVESLEQSIDVLNSKTLGQRGQVQVFLSERVSLGGFFENSITSIWGPDTSTQLVADRHKLGINLAADLGHRIRLVSQYSMGFNYPLRNEHNNPSHGSAVLPTQRQYGNLTFGSLLSQAFGEFSFGETMKFQFGMGYVPFGRAFQVREPVLFLRNQGPQIIRTASTTEIIIADPFWKGLHLKGNLSENFGFNLYTSSSLDHGGKLGGGLRLWTQIGSNVTFGLSGQTAKRSVLNEYKNYIAYGSDLKLDFGSAGLNMEYAINSSDFGDVVTYYVQPFMKFFDRKLTVHLDADYMKNILGLTTLGTASVSDPYIKWEYGTGFNYQFLPNVKVRMDFLIHDYTGSSSVVAGQDRDYYSVSNSWGISF